MNDSSAWETVPNKKKQQRGDDRKKQSGQPPAWMLELSCLPPPLRLQPADRLPQYQQSRILLLVGLPGSGKSTAADCLCRVLPWMYVRVNQDELGSRQACLRSTEQALLEGKCPVIDRCNISRSQRQHFFLADVVAVDCVVLRVASAETCARRCKARPDHPTLDHQSVDRVLSIMTSEWQEPHLSEGFRSVRTATDEASLQAVMLDLLRI